MIGLENGPDPDATKMSLIEGGIYFLLIKKKEIA
jgi:hypothetical protein